MDPILIGENQFDQGEQGAEMRAASWKRFAPILVGMAILWAGGLGGFAPLGIDRAAQIGLTILLFAALFWITEAVPLFVTSFLILALNIVWLLPNLSGSSGATKEDFLAPFFSDIILLFLGGFVLSGALHKFRFDERLARWIIAKAGKSIPRLMFAVMLITALLSMWLSNTATAAMMLTLCLPIIGTLEAEDRYRKALTLAIPFSANLGGLGTPIGSPPNAIALQYMMQEGDAPSFVTWMMAGVPGVAVMLVVAWGVLMLLYRGTATSVKLAPSTYSGGRSLQYYLVLIVMAVTLFGWLTSGWHGLSSGTVALLPVIVFFGAGILTVTDLRELNWDVLLLMGGGLCLGQTLALSGLANWLIGILPIDGVDLFGLMVIFATSACLMSSVMSNTATANLIMPIIVGMNMDQASPLLLGTAFACTMAMPLPISTPPNAIAFSSGQINVKDMLLGGAIITFLGLVLAMTTGVYWWRVIGL